jgi:hypothetical protein
MFEGTEGLSLCQSGLESPDGWDHLLFNLLCIISLIDKDKYVRVQQIKSKFATLRFYFSWNGPARKRTLHDRYVDFIWKMPKWVRRLARFPHKKFDSTYERIHDLIDLFEYVSSCTCEECGNAGEYRNSGHWLFTLCEKCWKEHQGLEAAKEQVEQENLLVSGHLQPKDLA